MSGSKSVSNRSLVLAALAESPSRIEGLLDARDTRLMRAGLDALGATIAGDAEGLDVNPMPTPSPAEVDCGLAGTVMRFLPCVAALGPHLSTFTGDERAASRPMAGLVEALRGLGAEVSATALPLSVRGPIEGGMVSIDSRASSQFVSALLLCAPRTKRGVEIVLDPPEMPSAPHVAMTVDMLRAAGARVDDSIPFRWSVSPGPLRPGTIRIEPDLTNASVFLAAAAIAGGTVTVPGWPHTTTQPGDLIGEILQVFGARVHRDDDGLRVSGGEGLVAADVDLHEASELTCVVAGLAACAEGTSEITGVGHIRGHETDRLAALCTELNSLGIECEETRDGLRITGRGPHPTRPLRSYADHRMTHFAALVALRAPGLTIDGADAVGKTMPDFMDRWEAMIMGGRQ